MSRDAELLRRIEELEEENRYLRSQIAPLDVMPRAWRLSPMETRMVVALAKAPGCLPRERVRAAVGALDRDVSDRTVATHVARARRKLDPHGVEIKAVWGVGYIMSPQGRVIVQDVLASVAAGEVA